MMKDVIKLMQERGDMDFFPLLTEYNQPSLSGPFVDSINFIDRDKVPNFFMINPKANKIIEFD